VGSSGAEKLDLVGTFEAHLILGVERSRISRFLHENEDGKDRIAEPLDTPRCGPIWHRAQIEATAKKMYAAAGSPHGKTRAGFDRWVVERAVKRALPLGLPADELSAIIRRPVDELAAAA